MFREMRRKNQALDALLCREILQKTENGVLALLGDEEYPYAVPLNHVMMDGKLYFHCAVKGHKVDAIKRCSKASYCVVAEDEVDAQNLSTRFRSVIAFGQVRMVEEMQTKKRALQAIAERFAPDNMAAAMKEIDDSLSATGIIELTIEHLSGKESKALARERREK